MRRIAMIAFVFSTMSVSLPMHSSVFMGLGKHLTKTPVGGKRWLPHERSTPSRRISLER
jgi:hypothetical protein